MTPRSIYLVQGVQGIALCRPGGLAHGNLDVMNHPLLKNKKKNCNFGIHYLLRGPMKVGEVSQRPTVYILYEQRLSASKLTICSSAWLS